jgi:hypothetical protein
LISPDSLWCRLNAPASAAAGSCSGRRRLQAPDGQLSKTRQLSSLATSEHPIDHALNEIVDTLSTKDQAADQISDGEHHGG